MRGLAIGQTAWAVSSTGNPLADVLLNYGPVGVMAIIALLVARVLYQKQQSAWDQSKADQQAAWDQARVDQQSAWDQIRLDLIEARKVAEDRAQAAERTRDAAMDGLKNFMEIAQTQTMKALQDSQAALSEAVTRERVQYDRISNLEREIEFTRRQQAR